MEFIPLPHKEVNLLYAIFFSHWKINIINKIYKGNQPFFALDEYFSFYFASCPLKSHQNCDIENETYSMFILVSGRTMIRQGHSMSVSTK